MFFCIINRETYSLNCDASHDGGSLHIAKLVRHLTDKGHQVDIYAEGYENQSNYLPTGVKVYRIGSIENHTFDNKMLRYKSSAHFFSNMVISHPNFDISKYHAFHVHHWSSCFDPLTTTLLNKPMVYTPHLSAHQRLLNSISVDKNEILFEESKLLDISNVIVALSENEKDFLIANTSIEPEKISIIGNGVNSNLLAMKRLKISHNNNSTNRSSECEVATVGRISWQKNYEPIIHAIRILRDRYNYNVRLVIIGRRHEEVEYEANLLKLIERLGLINQIMFTGEIPTSEVYKRLCHCDVYLQASHMETQGIALIEAMALGCPIVINRNLPLSNLIDYKKSGLVADCSNYQNIAHSIHQIISNKNFSEKAEECRKEIVDKFSWEHCFRKTEKLLVELGKLKAS